MSSPVIGISSLNETATRNGWPPAPYAMIAMSYVQHVEAAGGLPVLLPPREDADEDMARELVGRLDGLVLTGGADVAPRRYAEPAHPSVRRTRPDRDSMELLLAQAAFEANLPLLGICRGMQVMAIAGGGALEQHLPDRVHSRMHGPLATGYGTHPVQVCAGTLLATVQDARMDVPTHHHQAVRSHPGFEAAAWAEDDTLEAMEDREARFRVGVQWHPEVSQDNRLFAALVQASQQAQAPAYA